RESVGRIRHELERRHALASTRASRATLVGTKSLKEWLAEIALQTGNRIDGSRLPGALLDRLLTFEGPSREFWPTLDDLASRGEITFDGNDSSRGLVLKSPSDQADESSAIIGYAGPVRVTALPGAIVPIGKGDEPATAADRKRLVRVAVSVRLEPRL